MRGHYFACMLIVAQSQSEINLREAYGQHEFISQPLALFTVTGGLQCKHKSKLITILKELPNQKQTGDGYGQTGQQPQNTTTDDCPY